MKKLKVEFCDENGELVTVALSGQFSKERILQVIDLFDTHNGQDRVNKISTTRTSMENIIDLIKIKFNENWFTSKDISGSYREQYHTTVKSSTISTYLTRMYNNGYLERKGNRTCWQYHLMTSISTDTVGSLLDDLKHK
jgi:hypothetical protein